MVGPRLRAAFFFFAFKSEEVHDSSQITLDISENLTERNETNFVGVELSYDEKYQTISIVDHGLVDKVLA